MANRGERPRSDGKVTFDVLENLVVFGQRKDSGWTREAKIVCWNGGSPKLDIRDWNPDHERMSKGITLFEEEAEKLARVLCRRYGITADTRKGEKSGGYESFSRAELSFEDEGFDDEGSDEEISSAAAEAENPATEEEEEGGTS